MILLLAKGQVGSTIKDNLIRESAEGWKKSGSVDQNILQTKSHLMTF